MLVGVFSAARGTFDLGSVFQGLWLSQRCFDSHVSPANGFICKNIAKSMYSASSSSASNNITRDGSRLPRRTTYTFYFFAAKDHNHSEPVVDVFLIGKNRALGGLYSTASRFQVRISGRLNSATPQAVVADALVHKTPGKKRATASEAKISNVPPARRVRRRSVEPLPVVFLGPRRSS